MTVTSGDMYSVGARRAVIFALTAAGLPAATAASGVVYEGIEVLGIKNFEYTIPPVRKIVHSGNDRVLANDFLPSLEGAGAVLTVAGRSLALDAMIANIKVVTLGESKFIAQGTDQQGSEPDVAIAVYQQAKDSTLRSRRYRMQVLPKCVISAQAPGQSENVAESKYEVAISPTTKHLWGLAFSIATDGCLEADAIEGMYEGRPNIVAWLGDNVITKFLFPVAKQATATGKIHAVYKDGILDSGCALAVDGITPTVKPTAGQIVVAIYEY